MHSQPLLVQNKVGSGGLAEVYRAIEPGDPDQVRALKVLRPEQVSDVRAVRALRREAELLESFDHENLPKGYGMNTYGQRPGIVMEHLDGATLGGVLKTRGRLSLKQTASVVAQVASGLKAAASPESGERGVVHNDVKPDNIHVDWDGKVKVIDWGAAQTVGSRVPATERQGTMRYAAPERVQTSHVEASSADVFSLASVAFQSVTGRPLFPDVDVHAYWTPEARQRRIDAAFDETETRWADAPEAKQFLTRMWDPEPSRRPALADVAEFFTNVDRSIPGPTVRNALPHDQLSPPGPRQGGELGGRRVVPGAPRPLGPHDGMPTTEERLDRPRLTAGTTRGKPTEDLDIDV